MRDAPPNRSIQANIAMCRDALNEPAPEPVAPIPAPALWKAPDTSGHTGAPWVALKISREEYFATVAPSCETVPGGAP